MSREQSLSQPRLEATGIEVVVATRGGERCLLAGLDLRVESGEILGLCGSSGAGKTLTALTLGGLLPPPLRWRAGYIRVAGRLLEPGLVQEWREIRGRGVFVLFQSPGLALNPRLRIGLQIAETLVSAHGLARRPATREAARLLERVGLTAATTRAYPFQLSGGMRQRVLIAIAMGLRPSVVIADEPTTGLDPARRDAILELLRELVADTDAALLMISHDLEALAHLSRRIGVLDAGRLVEIAPTAELFARPRAVATQQLVASLAALRAADDQPVD
ncbi:ATP-binding cassette domain-containing protein [Thioalkalicoccus limnaeus]|uniref:ABC-type dipeptide transporter n=1 Tax=Thioalkalicoccus limnaeus TaxID=120681 RepID=A0ABV4BGY6_9GAMM